MKSYITILVCFMALSGVVLADTFGTGDNQFNIDFVTIGNAGNVADIDGCSWYGYPSPSGAVGYEYRIGTKEITAEQWRIVNTAAGIDDSYNWSGNQPVAGVS
jgi:hypothetical protein